MIGGIQLPEMLLQGVDPESPEIIRLAFARGEVPMGAAERLGVLTCLAFDPSERVKNVALKSLVELEDDFLEKALTNQILQPLSLELLLAHRPCTDKIKYELAAHPNVGEKIIRRFALSNNKKLLDTLADNQRGLTKWPEAARELLDNPALDLAVKGRLASLLTPDEPPEPEPVTSATGVKPLEPAQSSSPEPTRESSLGEPPDDRQEASVGEDAFAGMAQAMAQFEAGDDTALKEMPESLLHDAHIESDKKNVGQLIQTMSVSEKIRLATLGSKSARRLLARDSNRVIVNAVIRSPKIQEDEVIAFAQDKTTADDVILYILIKKEWLKNYQVRLGLCQNPKTPIPRALRMLGMLQERDLRTISKSKNVSGVIASAAMRILMQRNKK
jgi:hypothetical protein